MFSPLLPSPSSGSSKPKFRKGDFATGSTEATGTGTWPCNKADAEDSPCARAMACNGGLQSIKSFGLPSGDRREVIPGTANAEGLREDAMLEDAYDKAYDQYLNWEGTREQFRREVTADSEPDQVREDLVPDDWRSATSSGHAAFVHVREPSSSGMAPSSSSASSKNPAGMCPSVSLSSKSSNSNSSRGRKRLLLRIVKGISGPRPSSKKVTPCPSEKSDCSRRSSGSCQRVGELPPPAPAVKAPACLPEEMPASIPMDQEVEAPAPIPKDMVVPREEYLCGHRVDMGHAKASPHQAKAAWLAMEEDVPRSASSVKAAALAACAWAARKTQTAPLEVGGNKIASKGRAMFRSIAPPKSPTAAVPWAPLT